MTLFQTYDIRGVYPKEINAETVYKIAYTFAHLFHTKSVVVGRDARTSSPTLWKTCIQGLRDAGVNVTDIGLCTTPHLYFASGKYGYDGALMITASHLPKTYNGLKICTKRAVALSYGTGLERIERALTNTFPKKPKGTYQEKNIQKDYAAFLLTQSKKTNLQAVVDCSNGVGSLDIPILKKICTVIPLFTQPDGTFPNHGPDPLIRKNSRSAQAAVKKHHADLGIIFDADADRAIFLDGHGRTIAPDLITALIATYHTRPGDTILFDVRSSRYAQALLKRQKKKPVISKAGHSLMMQAMHKTNAVFGGEKSGHYFYKNFFSADNATLTAVHILAILHTHKKPFSTLLKHVASGSRTPELNYLVRNQNKTIQTIERHFKKNARTISHLDGLTVIHSDYWFNIRKSNTQPYLRVNIEAQTKILLTRVQKELIKLIY